MSSQDNTFTDFLDDYFAESAEHLASIRRELLALDRFVNRDSMAPDAADELLRALHSLKGLSSMVGFRDAEQVAHAMEGAIRKIKQTATGPTEGAMEALAGGTSVIEQLIRARQDQEIVPDVTAALFCLTAETAPGDRLWLFHFKPSEELSARGINVDSIRSRLQEIGLLLKTTPHIVEGGRITFDFTVAGVVDESLFSEWQADGLTAEPVKSAAAEAVMAEAAEVAPAAPPPSVVRVEMKRLDRLMELVGDMVISRGHMDESFRRLESLLPVSAWRELQDASLLLQRQLRSLRQGVMRVRMVPIGEIFDRMRFVIRGIERESRKEVRLELTGQNTEIDKLIVDRMMDPLLHMVRNAVSHGLETPEERIASGKPPEGQLRLRASAEAETLIIELEDDGRGVDIEQVAARALVLGLIEPGETSGKAMDGYRLLQILCHPGFSIREKADLASGRGVGMVVVKTVIAGLGGALAMDTRPGKGTRFTIRLPLLLSIMQALIVYINDQPFAVPWNAVDEVLRIETNAVTMLENHEVIFYRSGVLPIVYLRRLFRMDGNYKDSFHVFVARSDFGSIGIAVDRIAGQREIVVRAIEDSLIRVPGIAGATELGDGRPVLILDVAAIVDAARTGV